MPEQCRFQCDPPNFEWQQWSDPGVHWNLCCFLVRLWAWHVHYSCTFTESCFGFHLGKLKTVTYLFTSNPWNLGITQILSKYGVKKIVVYKMGIFQEADWIHLSFSPQRKGMELQECYTFQKHSKPKRWEYVVLCTSDRKYTKTGEIERSPEPSRSF